MPSTQPENKLLGLEILRFVTAFAILIWHYQHFSFVGAAPSHFVIDRQPFFTVFEPFFRYGLKGVQVFWCISGFIFFYKYREPLSERRVGGWKFFVLRFSRLYPLHIATLLLVVGLQASYFGRHGFTFVYENNDLKHFILQLFMASYWGLQDGLSFNGPIWSISLEVIVYFVFFTCLRLFGASNLVNLAILAIYFLAKSQGKDGDLLICLSFFYVGGQAAVFRRAFAHHRAWPLIQFGLLVGLVIGLIAAIQLQVVKDGDRMNDAIMILAPMLVILASGNLKAPMPIAKVIEAFGNLTYASYLIHFPIQLAAVVAFSAVGLAVPFYSNAFFLGYLAVVLGLSYPVFRFFEKPAQDRLRRAMLS